MGERDNKTARYTTDTAFSDSIKSVQEVLGSRGSMERLERSDTWPDKFNSDIKRWIKARDSVFLGSASADGQPYIQHRGGEPGFIQIPDDKTLLIPDYRGNRQYISLGNFSENPKAFLFMIDYETSTRIKFWGNVHVEGLSGDERYLRFSLTTWDVNCAQYLPTLWSQKSVEAANRKLLMKIEALEREVLELKRGA